MKIGFVFQRDSHLKAVQATAVRLKTQYDHAQTQFYAIDSDLDNQQMVDLETIWLSLNDLNQMESCDYLICCLGGYLLNKVIAYYQYSDVKVISLFPGVVSHYQLDAFISRFNADQVWLNCRSDYNFYTKICKVFRVNNNGILYGVAWFFNKKDSVSNLPRSQNPSIIFFEQTQIITNASIAQKFEKQLIDIIKNKPNKLFIYKLRQDVCNDLLIKIRQNLTRFDNVQLLDELTNECIYQADSYLTIASSAVIEGLLLDKRCYLLNPDFLDKDSQEIFSGSNLFVANTTGLPNQNWLRNRVQMPLMNVNLPSIPKNHRKNFIQRDYLMIVYKILQLSLIYPKILRIIMDKRKIKSIQKSLEYL